MAFIKRYSLYAAIYLGAGIAVLFTHYLQTSSYSKDSLDEKLTLIAASHFSLSQLVDNLPGVFKESPHAAALKISDLRGTFLGAMYDARRMSAAEYRVFLDTKIFDPKNPTVPGYEMYVWEGKRRKLRILTLSLKRMQLSEYLSGMGRNYTLHYLIPLYILVGCFGLAGFHFFFAGKRLSFANLKIRSKKAEPQKFSPSVKLPSTTTANAWQLKSGVIAEGTIHATLAALRSMAGAMSASLYAHTVPETKARSWQGVAEVRGAITVRGEAMEIPQFIAGKHDGDTDILISADAKEWLFFNAGVNTAQICFGLRFASNDAAPPTDLVPKITTFVKANSRALLVEHYYENSILDSDSGLYSAPYAMFTLKEKILGGLPFATAVFKFSDADFAPAALAKVARTAIRIVRENFPAEEAPVVARGRSNNIMIIFNARKNGKENSLKSVRQLHTAYANLGRRGTAACIEDTAGCGSGARVIKILERLLEKSAVSGQLELYSAQQHLNII